MEIEHTPEACTKSLMAVRDTLDVLNGKWKLPIIIALDSGPKRFNELERMITGITPKLLSKELRDLEANEFITRTVYPTTPVKIEYALTGYSGTLSRVIAEMRDWGIQHRKKITGR
ncbi:DNA-binding HxlR family transcriptional regulator [Flavobacterium gossypii]|jgi:Predicted transcriptional regulators|uniref:DNA-binding HxlR family transcriptional regulator n=2 Tax=Flavobacterium TaxID=237 RepID=A0A495M3J1_9FLAO|nr:MULTISPECIES: helix-turn-helix domain-containing protein [Flavobacterium]MBA9074423.1 DNA-binding HxlR family transcriptional regulator [Flavobacterium gossypii]RKS19183.1 DNA-binding HxlR family transcriptional regulator [Flavobacterium endophyticum]